MNSVIKKMLDCPLRFYIVESFGVDKLGRAPIHSLVTKLIIALFWMFIVCAVIHTTKIKHKPDYFLDQIT